MANPRQTRRVVIVGAGSVGSSFAYALQIHGLCEEIVLIDRQEDLLRGEVLDLSHGKPFSPPVAIRDGSPEDYADADVIVITAGSSQKPGESRLDLLQRNARIMESIVDDIGAADSAAAIVVVTNPVDLLTQIAARRLGDTRRVLGS